MSDLMTNSHERKLFETVMITSTDAILSKTPEGRIMAWNPAAERLYGYSASEAIGQMINLIIPLDRIHELATIMEQLKRGQAIPRYESQRRHKDGRLLDVSVMISPLLDEHQQVIGALSFAHDISLRKELEHHALEQAHLEQAKRLIDANIIGVMVTDATHILEANDLFLTMLGSSREAFERGAIDWAAINPPEYAPLDLKVREELQARGACTPFEKEYIRKDGSRVPVLIGGAALTVDSSKWIAFVLDQTVRKELERRKSELLTIASHELRTPLTAINGYLEVVLASPQEALSPSVRPYLQIVQRNAVRLIALVNDMLDLDRLEAGSVELRHEVLDLNRLARQVAEDLRPDLEARQQHFTLSLLTSTPLLVGEPNRLLQVLTNLLSNASKFTPIGGSIWLSLREEQDRVSITFKDTGIGMTPEVLSHLFTRFYRAQPFATGEKAGTGMGLVISQTIIKIHKGTIEVESEYGKGSTFTVTLPVLWLPPRTVPHPSTSQSRRRILVVEDEADHASLMSQLLEQEGFEVHTTFRGETAASLAADIQPDLLLLDVQLPSTSGLHVLQQMKEQQTTAAIPVLLLTITENKEQAVLLGARDVLAKPFSREQLLQHVHIIFQGEQDPLVLIASNDPLVRGRLSDSSQQIRCRMIEATTLDALLQLTTFHHPQLVLLDGTLLHTSGAEALNRLFQQVIATRISLFVMGSIPDALYEQRHRRWTGER